MTEDHNHIDYFQLISRYLSGEASDAEVQLLEEWVLASPENKAQFNAFRDAWIFSGISEDKQPIDVEQEWQAMAGELFSEGKVVPLKAKSRHRIVWLSAIAAAAVIVLLASVWLVQYLNEDGFVEVVSQNEIEEDRLPDGTEISLNQFSSVTYTREKDQPNRRVELTGDAFFEVERDTAHPFVITAREIEIEVLGTAFYVDARDDQNQVQVIVQSGLVSVTAGTQQVILSVDEIGIYDKTTQQLTKKENDDVNYMAWKTDVLVFDGSTLESVVFDLNRKFHANISIANEEIRTCEITTTFNQMSLETVLKVIEKTLNIQSEVQGEDIVFSGQFCE